MVPPYNSLHRTIGPIRRPVVQMEVMAVTTNKPTTSPYRGAGGPERIAMERTMDLIAKELGMDPTEVRRINMLSPDAFPTPLPPATPTTRATSLPLCSRLWICRLRRTAGAATQPLAQRTADGCGRIHLHEG